MTEVESSVYQRVGGDPVFERIVEEFYARVAADPVLRPMFPEDLTEGKRWQFLFLTQFFGGPARYAVERGHPRLRMRHSPFPIDQQARDHWLSHMLAAIDALICWQQLTLSGWKSLLGMRCVTILSVQRPL